MKILVLLSVAAILSACANPPPKEAHSKKKLKLETIDHGPMRPKTYVYREVN